MIIRQAIISDKQAIFRFLEKAYGELAAYKFPERWEWEFENNPFKERDIIPVWLAISDSGDIIGQIGAMIEPVKIGNRTTQLLYWAVDLVVLPDYRNQKIGFKLSKTLFESTPNIIALPMSEAFRHYLLEFGSHPISKVLLFKRAGRFDVQSISDVLKSRIKKLSCKDLLLRVIQGLRIPNMLTKIVNAAIWVHDLKFCKFDNNKIHIYSIEEFDHRFDILWKNISQNFNNIIERKSDFLNWKYKKQPMVDYKIFAADKNGELSGYIILRLARKPESNSGIIADLFASPGDKTIIESLLKFSIDYFKEYCMKQIIAASSIKEYQIYFKKLGFKVQKQVTPLFLSKNKKDAYQEIKHQSQWFFGRSDHDWDQYPYS